MVEEKPPKLGVVVPCYNEEDVLADTCKVLVSTLAALQSKGKVHPESFVLFVDDGSTDATWSRIIASKEMYPDSVKGIRLARNSGHQNALIAGLEFAQPYADVCISIDADLQDDVRAMESMVDHHREGAEIVYGVRNRRDSDTFFKKYTALFFYRLMQFLGVRIVYNHADYRLTSRRVNECLRQYGEENLFLRGIFPTIGFRSAVVYYDRKKRSAGVSKYPFRKMLAFALDGVTSFSIKPLRFVMAIGFLVFTISLLMGAYIMYAHYHYSVVPGWSSVILSIYFLGGVQLFALGIIGEYMGKMYREVKHRPRYFIETSI